MIRLGVNIDHVATLRQARGGVIPDPIEAALICQRAGADSIVAHLREDRRHIQDKDTILLQKKIKRFNLEMSINPGIVDIACSLKPYQATLVPEKRQELTTEGGLDVVLYERKIKKVVDKLKNNNIVVSLFIDPEKRQIDASRKSGCEFVELHTGRYADSKTAGKCKLHLQEIAEATKYAKKVGLRVNAGHGLNYQNVASIARIPGMEELNIGHSIVSYAVFVGLEEAVRRMINLMNN